MNTSPISDYLRRLAPANDRKKIHQVYHVLPLFALIIAILPFFFWTQSIGFRIFNVSVILIDKIYLWTLSIALIILWIIYFFSNRILFNKYLIWIHICITLTGIAFIIATGKWFWEPGRSDSPQYTIMRVLLNSEMREISLLNWKAIIFVVAQLIFIANVSIGLIRRNIKRHTT